jgi:2-polyprenyl-6-methoxyphenol hydroxylase-like FAD-dependent oxidoreductase
MVILGISSLIPIIDKNKPKFITSSEYNSLYNINNNNQNNNIKRKQMQWLDGDVRVFTMPFDKDKTMWQLSYHLDEDSAKLLTGKSKELKNEALSKCDNWDTSLLELLQSTNEDMISGHPTYDRDPFEWPLISRKINVCSRVSFIGDSIHPMSPFKGQGANQALVDAISLANAIASSNITRSDRRHISEALNLFEKDMCIRSKPKVIKSRNSSVYLHSKSALNYGNMTRSMAAKLEYDKLK